MEKSSGNQSKLQNKTVYGVDINEDTCRTAKMNMILMGDGQTNIVRRNSLNFLENEYLKKDKKFDVVITNMPFKKGTYENTENPYCYKHKNLLEEHKEISCSECQKKLSTKC